MERIRKVRNAIGHLEAFVAGSVQRHDRLLRFHDFFHHGAADAKAVLLILLASLNTFEPQFARFIFEHDECSVGLNKDLEKRLEYFGKHFFECHSTSQAVSDLNQGLQTQLRRSGQLRTRSCAANIDLARHGS